MTDHSMHHGTCLFLVENLVCCLIVIHLQMICIWLDSLACHLPFSCVSLTPNHCCMSLTAERAKSLGGHNLLQCSDDMYRAHVPSDYEDVLDHYGSQRGWSVDHYGSQQDWLVLSRLLPHSVSWTYGPFTSRKQQRNIIIVLARRT